MIRRGANNERGRNDSSVDSSRSDEEHHDIDGSPLSRSPQEADQQACTKSCNRRVSGSIGRLRQNHQLIWAFQASMLLLCLHSVASRFDSISAVPTVEGMQRRLSVREQQTRSDTSFRQPRVLQVEDSSFQASQNLVHRDEHNASKYEIQITKSERRANKKNLRNSYQYKKWQRDPLREGDCEPMDPWQETSFPSCNLMHEVDVAQQMEVLTEGGYNTIYKMKDIDGATHIVKILKYERDYSDRNFDRVRRDSLLMERASGSDYVIDTYSFCGFAQVIEYGKGGSLGDFLHSDYRRIAQNQKLQIATQVTQALADLHNLEGTGISSTTHGDFATKQYIFVNGRFKLSDFNRGRFIRWNKKTQEACPYTIGHNGDKFRAPEEYIKGAPQTAAIDVWGLGSLLVEVVSGLPAWYGYDNEVAQKAILEGIKPPFLREQISNPSGPINEVLLKAIDMCWVYEAKDRPKAGVILGYLKKEAMRLGIKWNEPFKLNGQHQKTWS